MPSSSTRLEVVHGGDWQHEVRWRDGWLRALADDQTAQRSQLGKLVELSDAARTPLPTSTGLL
jgi:hypothetical protein